MRLSRMLVFSAAIGACAAIIAPSAPSRAAERATTDPKLTAAVTNNSALQALCGGCIRKAEWIGASYPRVTVDSTAFLRLEKSARITVARRALAAASVVYLEEWAASDIYQRINIVDRVGTTLLSFEP